MRELRSKCCGVEIYRLTDDLVTDDDFYRAVGKDLYVPRCSACGKPIKVEKSRWEKLRALKMREEKVLLWLARRIPRKFLYWIAIRICVIVTSGKYSDTIVPELTFMDALKRLE